jgi:hypothetical protein
VPDRSFLEKKMSYLRQASGFCALFLLAVAAAAPAEARIRCSNGFQIVNGQPIATPYCQDLLVAQVAREHGMRVSDAEVRYNPNTKRNVCQFVGRDIRVYQACIDANSVGRRGF